MDKPLTITQLLKFCQDEIKKGHGDCTIILSNDDEGNGYHYCWYAFTDIKEDEDFISDYIVESVAPKDKTIILG